MTMIMTKMLIWIKKHSFCVNLACKKIALLKVVNFYYYLNCSSMSVDKLEPEAQEAIRKQYPQLKIVYFNKGLWCLSTVR